MSGFHVQFVLSGPLVNENRSFKRTWECCNIADGEGP